MKHYFTPQARPRVVALWLFFCAFFVVAMIGVGGYTRLTESGLSITEWKPVSGAVPPQGAMEWEEAFRLYQESPEYQKINKGMSLEAFKEIYWVEFIHRLLGRTVGFVFFAPFIVFLAMRWLRPALSKQLLLIFVLGGLQGVAGWFMVKSGLVDHPEVSHYRLTLHLGLAFLIFGFLWSLALSIWQPRVPIPTLQTHPGLKNFLTLVVGAIFIQVLLGGLVAGLKAGLTYNTFPLMDGKFIPDHLFMMEPWYINFFENITMVQFQHRIAAYLVFILVTAFWWGSREAVMPSQFHAARHLLLLAVVGQLLLGIFTLIHVVPLGLALLHQLNAVLLFAISLFIYHTISANTK